MICYTQCSCLCWTLAWFKVALARFSFTLRSCDTCVHIKTAHSDRHIIVNICNFKQYLTKLRSMTTYVMWCSCNAACCALCKFPILQLQRFLGARKHDFFCFLHVGINNLGLDDGNLFCENPAPCSPPLSCRNYRVTIQICAAHLGNFTEIFTQIKWGMSLKVSQIYVCALFYQTMHQKCETTHWLQKILTNLKLTGPSC